MGEIRVFLKVKQEMTGRGCQNHLKYGISTAFCQHRKIARQEICAIKKKDLPIFCLLKESASILEQANRSRLRQFKVRYETPFVKFHQSSQIYKYTINLQV